MKLISWIGVEMGSDRIVFRMRMRIKFSNVHVIQYGKHVSRWLLIILPFYSTRIFVQVVQFSMHTFVILKLSLKSFQYLYFNAVLSSLLCFCLPNATDVELNN